MASATRQGVGATGLAICWLLAQAGTAGDPFLVAGRRAVYWRPGTEIVVSLEADTVQGLSPSETRAATQLAIRRLNESRTGAPTLRLNDSAPALVNDKYAFVEEPGLGGTVVSPRPCDGWKGTRPTRMDRNTIVLLDTRNPTVSRLACTHVFPGQTNIAYFITLVEFTNQGSRWTAADFQGMLTHELGHALGLTHLQSPRGLHGAARPPDRARYRPAMFPEHHPNAMRLAENDRASLSFTGRAIPTALTTIRGRVVDSRNVPLDRMNVVAEATDDELNLSFSGMSGRTGAPGAFELRVVPGHRYRLVVEPLHPLMDTQGSPRQDSFTFYPDGVAVPTREFFILRMP